MFEGLFSSISAELADVRQTILKQIQFSESFTEGAMDTVRYFFQAKGKLLRPALVLLSAKSIDTGSSRKDHSLVQLAAGLELIHSASLIHDDMIDQTDDRRGQMAMHRIFGEKTAVLAGDFLFVRGFSIISRLGTPELLQIVLPCVERMCGAEISAIQKTDLTWDDYSRYIEAKTAGFMAACCQLGCLTVECKDKQRRALTDFGYHFGMLYQITDDCMDGDLPSCIDIDWLEKIQGHSGRALSQLDVLVKSPFTEILAELTENLVCRAENRMIQSSQGVA